MADFTAEVFQNEFLPAGGTDVHGIVRITSTGATTDSATAAPQGDGSAAEVILIDTSGSMGRRGVQAAGTTTTTMAFRGELAVPGPLSDRFFT